METKKFLKSAEEIDSEFSVFGKREDNSPENVLSPGNLSNGNMQTDFTEISLSESTIQLLQLDNTENKTIKEIIMEEELKKLSSFQQKLNL